MSRCAAEAATSAATSVYATTTTHGPVVKHDWQQKVQIQKQQHLSHHRISVCSINIIWLRGLKTDFQIYIYCFLGVMVFPYFPLWLFPAPQISNGRKIARVAAFSMQIWQQTSQRGDPRFQKVVRAIRMVFGWFRKVCCASFETLFAGRAEPELWKRR